MSTLVDTTADAAAELHREQRPGEGDPPVTLSGRDAWRVREAMTTAYDRLARLEGQTKAWRDREGIRTARIKLGTALALLPAPHLRTAGSS